jgi:hypothetical protein
LDTVSQHPQDLNQLWGTRLQGICWDAHRAAVRFELFWTDKGREHFTTLALTAVRYSQFDFDEFVEHEVVELISVEVEKCVQGIRLFGELSNGSFELVCATFHIEQMAASGGA